MASALAGCVTETHCVALALGLAEGVADRLWLGVAGSLAGCVAERHCVALTLGLSDSDTQALALREGVAVAQAPLGSVLRDLLGEVEALAQAEALGVAARLRVTEAHTEALCATEAEEEALRRADALGEGASEAKRLRLGESDCASVCSGELLTLGEKEVVSACSRARPSSSTQMRVRIEADMAGARR